jgi:hypothetical protein
VDKQPLDIIDLNIGENYLSDWEVYYAIREIIANALDEQQNGEIQIIYQNEDEYIIRDFGSGLEIENFIMKGSNKATKNNVIGKFGVGLKDALGVLTDNGIIVEIKTPKYRFVLHMKEKSKMTNVKTLHVYVYENNEIGFEGTEFTLKNCKKEYIEQAKAEFLSFKDPKLTMVEETFYGDILEKENGKADIYINGMKISDDGNLTFSYNIKNISSKLKKALNRERKYVSRDAYRDDIKKIISSCKKTYALDAFENQLKRTNNDDSYSEIKWNDVLTKVCNYILSKYGNKHVRFIGNKDAQSNKELYDILRESKDTVIVDVSQRIREDIERYKKYINEDNLFIEDSIVPEDALLRLDELNEEQIRILKESISIIKEIDFIRNDLGSSLLDDIKISRVPLGSTLDKEVGIVIPLNSLTAVEICTVKIINVISSLGTNSSEFKERIVANLIKIIHERNKNEESSYQ